jgi:hypothetical protein
MAMAYESEEHDGYHILRFVLGFEQSRSESQKLTHWGRPIHGIGQMHSVQSFDRGFSVLAFGLHLLRCMLHLWEGCSEVPQGVGERQAQLPHFQEFSSLYSQYQNRALLARAVTGRECEIVCPHSLHGTRTRAVRKNSERQEKQTHLSN